MLIGLSIVPSLGQVIEDEVNIFILGL